MNIPWGLYNICPKNIAVPTFERNDLKEAGGRSCRERGTELKDNNRHTEGGKNLV